LKNYQNSISTEDLAKIAHVSESQLLREFQRLFAMSPGDYVSQVRLLVSRRLLSETDLPVGEIALECGFYDQSHFNKIFKKALAMNPTEYRRVFKRGA
jgi:transcriptional regulator GlxA family with amidase domain